MALDDVLTKIKKKFDFRKTLELSGTTFEIGILTLKEEQTLNTLDTDDNDTVAYFNDSRKLLLSFAIKKIDGEEVPDIVHTKDESGNPVTKEKSVYLKDFLDIIPPALIEDLFEAYIDLREEVEATLIKSMKYNWFKMPSEREKEREERLKASKESAKEPAVKTEPPKTEEPITFREIPKDEEPPKS